jgi:hypothetical protein
MFGQQVAILRVFITKEYKKETKFALNLPSFD